MIKPIQRNYKEAECVFSSWVSSTDLQSPDQAWASLRVRNVSLRVLCGRDQTGNWFHPQFFTLHCDWSKAWIFPMNHHCCCRWLLPRMIQAGADYVQVLIIAVETLDHSLIIIVEQHVCGGRRKYSSLSYNDIMTIITTTTGIRP